jgi:outer membrane immunogenic protein
MSAQESRFKQDLRKSRSNIGPDRQEGTMHPSGQVKNHHLVAFAAAFFGVMTWSQVAEAGDWTGVSLGASLGWNDASGPGLLQGEDSSFGLHLGYDRDFGNYVLGGEIELENSDLNIGTVTLDSVSRIKLRAGYDFGSALGYVTVGGANAETSIGNESGTVFGLGLSYSINDQFSIGGEVLRQNFDALDGTGGDTDVDSVSLRASFRF